MVGFYWTILKVRLWVPSLHFGHKGLLTIWKTEIELGIVITPVKHRRSEVNVHWYGSHIPGANLQVHSQGTLCKGLQVSSDSLDCFMLTKLIKSKCIKQNTNNHGTCKTQVSRWVHSLPKDMLRRCLLGQLGARARRTDGSHLSVLSGFVFISTD